MTRQDAFEARLERMLHELSDPAAGPARPETVAAAVAAAVAARPRVWPSWLRRDGVPRRGRYGSRQQVLGTAFGAAAVVVVLVLGGAFYLSQRGHADVGGPSQAPRGIASPSESASASPAGAPTAVPSPATAPPADLQAFVASIHDRFARLPPVAMTWLHDGSAKSRIYVDGSGAVRIEYFSSADATVPMTYKILKGQAVARLLMVGGRNVWDENDEAIGEDPRVYIIAEIMRESSFTSGPGCDVMQDPNTTGGTNAASGSPSSQPQGSGWRYVGLEDVAGRPAHHIACVGDLWIDVETGLILKTSEQLRDDADQPIVGAFRTAEVTQIDFGEQPTALFEMTPPKGVADMTAGGPFNCTPDLICSERPSGSDSSAP
jgi:hypothetical protein